MKNESWYKSWFASPDYLALYKHRDSDDARRIISLLFKKIRLKRGSRILDIACGSGRHSFLLAKKGFNVTGLDLSRYLINSAKRKLNGEYSKYQKRLTFEIRDMRDIRHKGEFDMAVNLFTSFGYFMNDSDNEKVIKGISRALKPGGYFLLDFLNSDYLRRNIVPFDTQRFNGKVAVQLRGIVNKTVTKDIYIFSARKPKHYYPEMLHFTEKIKLYTSNDFNKMFRKYGLRILFSFGEYDGSKFDKRRSKRLILIAKKLD